MPHRGPPWLPPRQVEEPHSVGLVVDFQSCVYLSRVARSSRAVASPIHTVLVELLEAHPEALAYLLELQGEAPSGPLIPTTGTRTKTFTLARRVARAFPV